MELASCSRFLKLFSLLFFMILFASKAYDDDDLVQEVVSEDADEDYLYEDQDRSYQQQTRSRRPYVHPLTDMPPASEDIYTASYFPKHPDLRLPIGEEVTILCHLENEGEADYNISAIMGSLNHPQQFNFYVQNFSAMPIGGPVAAGVEFTFAYKFMLHPSLEPNEFALATTIFYDDGALSYSSTFFNGTVELYHAQPAFTSQDLLKMLVTLGATLLLGYLSFNLAFGKKSAPSAAAKTQGKSEKDDWASDFLGNAPKKPTPRIKNKKGGSKKK